MPRLQVLEISLPGGFGIAEQGMHVDRLALAFYGNQVELQPGELRRQPLHL